MILLLYAFLVTISLVLIIIGLAKPEESAQAIIGFFFLFLLSFVIMNGNLEYQTGENVTTTFTYNNNLTNSSHEVSVYNYDNFNDPTSRMMGYYLAIASAIGFACVLYSLKGSREEED